MKYLDHWSYFLRLKVFFDGIDYYLSQAKYVIDLLSHASLFDTKIVKISLKVNVKLCPTKGDILDDPTLYEQLVGSLFLPNFHLIRYNICYSYLSVNLWLFLILLTL